MTPKVAEAQLMARRKRVITRRGPRSLGFTITECDAVRVLASCAHSHGSIAARAGMTVRQFKQAREKDSKLDTAFEAGLAEEQLNIMSALLKTALDPKNPRQIQSAVTLLKARHGFTESGGRSVNVEVTNMLTLPPPQDARSFQSALKRVASQSPTVIEHAPDSKREPIRAKTIGEIIGRIKESDA